MNKKSVFGAFGFIGSEYCRKYYQETIRVPRHEVVPPTNDILYFISTTDNYNIYDSVTLDIETNLIHLMEVLDAAQKTFKNNFTFTFISSWFVYGRIPVSKDNPFTEETNCNPTGFYSITKRAAEQMLISYCETFKINYRILRLANVLGARDRGVSKKKNALQYMIDRLVHGEMVELYDGGEVYRDYIDVRDCIRAIRLAMGEENKHKILNISNGESQKLRDIINYARDVSGSTSLVWEMHEKPEFHSIVQTKDVFISNKKLQELGYVPEFPIKETIQEIVNAYKG